jgi:hypothetical protein
VRQKFGGLFAAIICITPLLNFSKLIRFDNTPAEYLKTSFHVEVIRCSHFRQLVWELGELHSLAFVGRTESASECYH